jgi:hypothetical protein
MQHLPAASSVAYTVSITNIAMGVTVNFVAGALLIIWIVEYFGYHSKGNIHILLLLAIILFIGKIVLRIPAKHKL